MDDTQHTTQTASAGANAITIGRPAGITDQQWERLGLAIDEIAEATVHHTWCSEADHTDHGSKQCASGIVDFTNTPAAEGEEFIADGLWGNLAADQGDEVVTLEIEGRPSWWGREAGCITDRIPVWHVRLLLDIVDNPAGRAALDGLLARAQEDYPESTVEWSWFCEEAEQ